MFDSWMAALGDWLHAVFVLKVDGWVALGFLAQGMFMMRFVVQWIATERQRRSVVPTAFWFFSVAGGVLLLIYAAYRGDPVFIIGQLLGLIIYVRNIHFILREKEMSRSASPALTAKGK